MAIQSNASDVEVTGGGGGIPLYTGIAPMSIVAVNPTLKELNDLGVAVKTEPEYTGISVMDGVFNKIVFWLKNEEFDFFSRIDILVKPEAKVSNSGKNLWINKFGRVAYADGEASKAYEWYSSEGERKAFHGEDIIISLIQAWANVSTNGDCYLESPQDAANAKVDELRNIINSLPDNKVRVLLGVKDGKYQQVYTRHFGRIKPMRNDLFVKELNKDFGAFNAEYNSDFELKAYTPELVTPDSSTPTEDIKVETNDWL